MNEEQVKKYWHNLELISNELDNLNELRKIGIERVTPNLSRGVFDVHTSKGEKYEIYEFTGVRYKAWNKIVPAAEQVRIGETANWLIGVANIVDELRINNI